MNKVESALQRTTDTKALVIGVGTLPRTAEMFNELFPGCRAVVVADTNTWLRPMPFPWPSVRA